MINISKAPIAEQVRKGEIELAKLKYEAEALTQLINEVTASDSDRHLLKAPSGRLSNIGVCKVDYLKVLHTHMKVLNSSIANLEAKLTTVYAAINDCLAD